MILLTEKMILKKRKGEDGHKVFSVRLTDDRVAKLDQLSADTGKSRNELITMCIDFAMEHCEVIE